MLDLLLPARCALCRSAGDALCATCVATLPPAPDLGPPPGFVVCWSLLRYEGTTRDLISALKFRNHRDAIPLLGAAMAELIEPGTRPQIDLVTWAPTSPDRRRARGFDQAELLARAAARRLGRPCHPLLRRTSSGAQTGHSRAARLSGPQFESRPGRGARGRGQKVRTVLVVDDVRTTGATLCAAADALMGGNAQELVGLTLAVTL